MPFDSEKRSKEAKKRLRDKSGHFISLKPKVKLSGQANLISKLIETGEEKDESSILSIKFRDPLQKIIQILKDIKDKQSTRVNLSFTIPLVALPIVILLAFQFGRYQSSCNEHFSSQIGTLENITITKTIKPDHWFLKALTNLPFASDLYSREETLMQSTLVKGEQGIIIENKANVNLNAFTGGKVIIFGEYNSCNQTLTLDSEKNISNY